MTQKSKTSRGTRSAKPAARGGAGGAATKRRRGRPTKQESQAREAEYERQFEGERLIHRYANRRFYDLAAKKPITLEELADLVRKDEMVRVIDVENGDEDITRRVLTQIIREPQNQNSLELLPVEFLRKLIASDSDTAKWIDAYLKAGASVIDRSVRQGLDIATAIQDNLREMTALATQWPEKGNQTRQEQMVELEALKRQLETYLKAAGRR